MQSHWRNIPDFIRVGSTGKTRGIHGELKLFLDEHFAHDVLESGYLFLDRDGNKVPLAIETLREKQDILVKFEEINDPTEASVWSNLDVYLPSDEVTSKELQEVRSQDVAHELVGFRIIDTTLGTVGTISEVRELPQQEMAIIEYKGREVMIPLTADYIKNINYLDNAISMELPDGILDL